MQQTKCVCLLLEDEHDQFSAQALEGSMRSMKEKNLKVFLSVQMKVWHVKMSQRLKAQIKWSENTAKVWECGDIFYYTSTCQKPAHWEHNNKTSYWYNVEQL